MKWKKLVLVALAATMAIGAAGCGSQQKADAGSEKHGNMRVSPVENFDSTVKKAPCEKYNGICLYWSKCHRNTMPF